MREHMGLFRGKRVDNGEWVEGNLVDCPQNFRCKRIVNFGCLSAGVITRWEQDVIPETVGECTGLTDKNGKLIFEGDILEGYDFDADSGYGVVELYDGAFEVANDDWVGTFHENYRSFLFEIIGNVHDNPELVKGAGDDAAD